MRLGILFLLATLSAHAEPAGTNVRGVVADESGGVLPGVTVVAQATDGRVLTTVVTDGAGRYVIGPIDSARVTVTFQLAGFSPAVEHVALRGDADAVVNKRLAVAPRSETVEVFGRIPVLPLPPGPPAPRAIPARPRPVTMPVPAHDRDSVCGPAKIESMSQFFGTIRERRSKGNLLHSEGDELTIDGGTSSGLEAGQNFVVRRTFRTAWDPRADIGEHTSGLVQIVSADESTAVAMVIYACDAMMSGDRLAAFTPEPVRAAQPEGTSDFKHAVQILFPDMGQLLGAPRKMLVIDSGSAAGVHVGQRVTIFRRHLATGNTPSVVADATVVAVRDGSATIRVDRVTDAIMEGDLAALQR